MNQNNVKTLLLFLLATVGVVLLWKTYEHIFEIQIIEWFSNAALAMLLGALFTEVIIRSLMDTFLERISTVIAVTALICFGILFADNFWAVLTYCVGAAYNVYTIKTQMEKNNA